MKEKTFKLEPGEYLRVRKRGNYYFAYARWTKYGGQKERYLGRCNPDGTPYDRKRLWGSYRGIYS